jgi:deazaflavin-dependent oxidoreductase (nitroreductase family)
MDFDPQVIDAAGREREVELTTYGRRSGRPHRVTIWVSGVGRRLFIRSGGGLGPDWTKNLLKRPDGVIHMSGMDVPVSVRQVADPEEARAVSELVMRKYGASVRRSREGEALTPAETATFELLPVAGRTEAQSPAP